MSGSEKEKKPKKDTAGRIANGRFALGNRIQMLGNHGSLYKPEYCEMLIDHMTEGFSYKSFAGKLGITKQALYKWEKDHPEFAEAKEIGLSRSLYWWEALSLEHARYSQRGYRVDPVFWKYNMTVRFSEDWREETIQHQHQTITEVTITEKKREE